VRFGIFCHRLYVTLFRRVEPTDTLVFFFFFFNTDEDGNARSEKAVCKVLTVSAASVTCGIFFACDAVLAAIDTWRVV
jgi:hypothetical protein